MPELDVRIKLAALWTSMLFVFGYVDIFGLYRPDTRASLAAGEIGGFTVDQAFLAVTTAYIVIPSLMVYGALVLRPRLNRTVNLVLSGVYALTIVAGAIGEWGYYVFASVVEVALLAAVARHAWRWDVSG